MLFSKDVIESLTNELQNTATIIIEQLNDHNETYYLLTEKIKNHFDKIKTNFITTIDSFYN